MKASLKKPTTKSAAKPTKPNPKFVGKVCEICGAKYVPHAKTGKYPRWLEHHIRYADPAHPDLPEIKAVVCLSCHNWMHGNGKIWSHPFKKDSNRAEAPFWFAMAVVQLYDRKLIIPAIVEAMSKQKAVVITTNIPPNETTH